MTPVRMSPVAVLLVTTSLLLPILFAAAAPVSMLSFARSLDGWEVLAEGTASVTMLSGQGSGGGNCARLVASADHPATLISPALDLDAAGMPFEVQLQIRALTDDGGPLQIGLASGHTTGQPPTIEPLWTVQPIADSRWHTLTLAVSAHIGDGDTVALAFTASQRADWAIDQVEVGRYTPPRSADHVPLGDTAVYPEPLPADWEPEGLLDARARELIGSSELVADVGGIQLRLPPEAHCLRGMRQGIEISCANRVTDDRQLTISVQGPPDVQIADWTLPVPGKSTVRVFLPVQRLVTGDCWLKLGFRSGSEQAFVPVKLHSIPAYPVMGVTWPNGQMPGEGDLSRVRDLGGGMHQLRLSADGSAYVLQHVGHPAGAAEWLLGVPAAPSIELPEASVAPASDGRRHLWYPLLPESSGAEQATAALCALAGQLHHHDHSPSLFSFPFSLAHDPLTARLRLNEGPALDAAHLGGCPDATTADSSVSSIILTLPHLSGATVLRTLWDGKPRDTVSAYWAQFGQGCDPAPVRLLSRQADMQLPFTVQLPQLGSSGDRRLDALKLGRIMASAAYQGATAVLLPAWERPGQVGLLQPDGLDAADDPVAQLHLTLAAELAAAVPVYAAEATDTMSPEPDARVTYKLFVRGDEGIVVMWNNTDQPQEVAVGLRSQPVTLRLLRLSHDGEFVQHQFQSIFRMTGRALETKQPGIYLRLDPLDITCLSLRLVDPHANWSRGVFPADEFKVEIPRRDSGPRWWERLFY